MSSSFFPGNYPANKLVTSWLIFSGFVLVFGIINIACKSSHKKMPIKSVTKLKKSIFDLIASMLFFVLLYPAIVVFVDLFMRECVANGRARNGSAVPISIWLKLPYYCIILIIPYFFTIKKAIKIWHNRNNYLIVSHAQINIFLKKEIIYKTDEIKLITIKEFRKDRDFSEYFLCINNDNISLADLNLNDYEFKIKKLIQDILGLHVQQEITSNYPDKITIK